MKLISVLLCLSLLALSSCAERTDDAAASKEPTFADVICGRYVVGSDETEDLEVIEITYINGNLVLESSQKYAAYYASELVCGDMSLLENSGLTALEVIALTFSGFSNFGEYRDEREKFTIVPTDNGLELVCDDKSKRLLTADENAEPIHNPPSFYTDILGGTSVDPSLVGTWISEDQNGSVYIVFEENGALTFCGKNNGKPIDLRIGGCITSDKTLTALTERCGYAQMPFDFNYTYYVEGDTLTLTSDDDIITLKKAN